MPRIRGLARTLGLMASVVMLFATACVSFRRPPFMASGPEREWPVVLERSQRLAADGRFEAADSVLVGFASRYNESPEALETAYWRAIFKLDPLNKAESLASAMSLLDSYLADSRPREHAAEATSLRRFTAQMDALAKAAPGAIAQPGGTARVGDGSNNDAEIKRLKDELAKANAELERIRRRLIPPE